MCTSVAADHVLTFCVQPLEPQQQALLGEHVDQTGNQWSFGLA